jgi:hypothetical protein
MAAPRQSESADLGECIIAESFIHFDRHWKSKLRKAAVRAHHPRNVGMKGESRLAATLSFTRAKRADAWLK